MTVDEVSDLFWSTLDSNLAAEGIAGEVVLESLCFGMVIYEVGTSGARIVAPRDFYAVDPTD
ncbi:hypothetical protein [Bosea lathyri]|uniref:Uncharacterized protein n=1 Tax=Bosea lathyri TaxID=1036778 RepID=A0A1H6BVU1_9HYPH|nr:hypothetical protein [Bosea lathyri]SEG64790.1 hypothetical protein SAMN04488115_108126 [Bosea lathyri]